MIGSQATASDRALLVLEGTLLWLAGVELNRFAVGKNELPLDPDDLGLSS